MGYRSEIRALVYGPPEKMVALKMAWLTTKQGFNFWAMHDEGGWADNLVEYDYQVHENGSWFADPNLHEGAETLHILNFWAEDWKWYSEYASVQAWHDFMFIAPEFDCMYEFVRVGEEAGDVDQQSSEDNHGWLETQTITTITDCSPEAGHAADLATQRKG